MIVKPNYNKKLYKKCLWYKAQEDYIKWLEDLKLFDRLLLWFKWQKKYGNGFSYYINEIFLIETKTNE